MITIYKVLRNIYQTKILTKCIEDWSEDYEKGFRYCLTMLLLAIENHPALNLHVEHMRLEIRVRNLESKKEKLEQEKAQLELEVETQMNLNKQIRSLLNLESQSSLKRMVVDLQTQVVSLQHQLSVNQRLYPQPDDCAVELIDSETI